MNYRVPLTELRFALHVNGRLPEILNLPAYQEVDTDTVHAILDEAAHFAEQEWASTNRTGDLNGAKLSDGNVHTHEDLQRAYQSFCETGWAGLRAPTEFGGQGLPSLVSAACEEMWCAANLSLSLLPMLTIAAVDTLSKHGSAAQQQTYLPKMCTGEWAGTMNLSEPNAGTDLAQVATKAVPQDDGSYRITGQKIFITWGEHDLAENIIHLVLARLPDAATGVNGISLFIVPKYLVNDNGSLGERNSVQVIGLEHKMGIHASPTCTLQFDDALGYMVGRAGKGLAYMFTMMKQARLNVGIEAHAVAERAYQNALAYAKERVQGRDVSSDNPQAVPIIHHADVRRMLLTQKAILAAQRALYLRTAALSDLASHCEDNVARKQYERELDWLVPLIKAWLSDNGVVLSNLAMQVFGGAGFIEETGVAQFVRDVRITPIYEGTNGIQAEDFAGRKTTAKDGALPLSLLQEGADLAMQLHETDAYSAANILSAIDVAQRSIAKLVEWSGQPEKIGAAASVYLQQMGLTLGAIELMRGVLALRSGSLKDELDLFDDFCTAQTQIFQAYCAYVLPQVHGLYEQIVGSETILDVALDNF
ncbi:acyl-CoA dehydrogenase [Wielerella bovis]|uniref:acyl-CoA dehydrogenase n=1 Tax=Wielerella bovis TaxID=2917790 RepID=UPI0020189D40|nr:acyl-CoA dehydrogenase [Wielerella bovis]MCG7656781.1 acyl-CoA dehydrogenase family protein [Wielerella bovis]MCG7659004.1 acyl-CoA dehydrogenase family protein [Wielerella bovis]